MEGTGGFRQGPPLPVAAVEPRGEQRRAMGSDRVDGERAGEDVGMFDMAGEGGGVGKVRRAGVGSVGSGGSGDSKRQDRGCKPADTAHRLVRVLVNPHRLILPYVIPPT